MDSSQNNPFGSFSSGGAGPSGFSAPVSNGAGDDIILSGATQKKTNKKLIIGIVAGVVLLIGAVVGFLMMQKKGLNASGTSKEEFNYYFNYLLYGEESSEKNKGEYDTENAAKIVSILDEDSKVMIPYGEKLKVHWDGFYGGVGSFELDDNVTLDDYNERVGFVTDYLRNSLKMSTTKILDSTKSKTLETISQEVKDYFALFEKYDFDEAKTFVEKGLNYYNKLISLIRAAKGAGCDLFDESNEIATTCNEEVVFSGDESYRELDIYFAEMDESVYNAVQYLIVNAWKINSFLNGDEG